MPFKSRSQMRKIAAMKDRGEIGEKTFEEFADATQSIAALPEKVSSGIKKKKKRKIAGGR